MAASDARPIPIKNTAFRVVFPILDADGDLVTGATGLDSEVSKDQGTFADCTNEATEIATSSGMYYLDLTSTEMNADCVAVIVKTSTSGAKTTTLVLYPEETGDINVDVTAFGGTAGTFSGGRPEVNTTHAAGTAWGSGAITAAAIASNAITSAKIASGAITSTGIAASAIGASQLATGAITNAKFAAGAIDAAAIAADAIGASELAADAVAEIADAIWDEATSGHVTAGSYGLAASDILADTADMQPKLGTPADTDLATDIANLSAEHTLQNGTLAEISAALGNDTIQTATIGTTGNDTTHLHVPDFTYGDDEINDYLMVVRDASTGNRYARWVADWVNSTKLATVATLPFTPENSTDQVILLAIRRDSGLTAAETRTAVGLASANLDTQLTAIDDYIDTEVAAIKAKTDLIPASPAATSDIPSAATIADAVWDEALSGHTTAGSGGKALSDIDTHTDTEVASILAAVDTEVAAIKAKTDNLPATPAATGDIPSAAAIADAVWDEDATGHQTQGTFGQAIGDPVADTNTLYGAVVSGAAGATIAADIVDIEGKVDDLESRLGTPSDLGSGATVAANLADIEAQTDDIGAAGAGLTAADDAILTRLGTPAGASVSADIAAVKAETASIQSDTNDIQSRIPASLVSGRIDASVGAMAADVLTAAATAADFGTEVATAVWASATRTLSALGFTLSASDLAADTIGASELAADAITEIVNAVLTTAMTESYNADGSAPTLAQALFVCMQRLTDFAISGTTITVKKLDGTTSAYTLTLDDATNPTSSTRAT